MPRRPRAFLPPQGTYHVTSCGAGGARIFRSASDFRFFLALLASVVDGFAWFVHAFCLMNTHYHVVLHARRDNVSRGVHRLNGVYAQSFNERYGRRGHLFGDRFAAWLIESDEHLSNACRYVLLNPVRAGLCERSDEWPWSGSRHGTLVD